MTEESRMSQLEASVRDLIERLGETNTSLGIVATKLDSYMADREKADARARRYQDIHDNHCRECQESLRADIALAAKAAPFQQWVNRYKILVAIALALAVMFGPDLGQIVIRLIDSGR